MIKQDRLTMYVDLHHLIKFEPFDLYEVIQREYFRYEDAIRSAVYNFMYQKYPEYATEK